MIDNKPTLPSIWKTYHMCCVQKKPYYKGDVIKQSNFDEIQSKNLSGLGTYQVSALDEEPLRIPLENVQSEIL